MLPSHDPCSLWAVAGWAKLMFGWLVAVLSAGAERAEPCRPRWLADHLAAAARLRQGVAGRTPELASQMLPGRLHLTRSTARSAC